MVTAVPPATSAVNNPATNPGTSILKTLSAGSGIDTTALVTQLSAAERADADIALQARTTSNSAQVSALAQVRSGLDSFVSALDALSADATLGPQPTSSDTPTASIALDPKVHNAAPLNATLTVARLAQVQTSVSGRITDPTAPIGQGTLTLTLGQLATTGNTATGFTPGSATPVTITIGAANDSLNGVRDAINAAHAGVTATILNDGQGSRLVLKGATGAANGFTLTAADAPANPDAASLTALAFAPGGGGTTTLATTAADAQFTVDGVAITRPTNVVSDVIAGYTLTLNSVQTQNPVTLASARDGGLTSAAVKDYVAAYNTLIGIVNTDAAPGSGSASSGPLYGQSTIAELRGQLAALSSRLGSGGTSLAAYGVSTARDGTLALDTTKLEIAVQGDTGQLQRLFAGTPTTDGSPPTDTGIAGAVHTLRDRLADSTGGFTTYSARLSIEAETITSDGTALDTRISAYTARLSAQFAAMNAAVAQYKSISSFLTQEIDAWNHTNSNGTAVTA